MKQMPSLPCNHGQRLKYSHKNVKTRNLKQIAPMGGNEVKQMKTIFLKPTLNPAFKITQPLPMLPNNFSGGRGRAATPFCGPVSAPGVLPVSAVANLRRVFTLNESASVRSDRLVA